MGASSIVDGSWRGEEEGTRLLENVSGGFHKIAEEEQEYKTIDNTEHKPIALKWYIKNYKN